MTPNRERVWVGTFVLAAIAVLSVTVIAVWGGLGGGISHRTYFKYSGGIQAGTPVRYGGMRVGTVRRVRVDPGDSTRIEVQFVVDRATPLKMDSVARLASLGILSDNYVEVSTGSADAAPLPPGSVLRSTETAGIAQLGDSIQSLIPQVHDVLAKFTVSLEGLQKTLARADDLLNDENRSNLGQALTRANDMLNDRNRSNLANSLGNLNQMLSESRPKISASLTSMNDVTAKLDHLLDDMKQTSARADEVLSNLNSALAENRQDLRISVSQLREVLANSGKAMDQLQEIMNQNSANIYEILENMRSASVNMRNLTETIQSNPATLIRGINVRDRRPGGIQK
jgi:phospholipid/cholesterol/gamma-HCH transport system substrate-binding protein